MSSTISKPWLDHYDPDVPASIASYPDRTLLDYLAESARSHPNRPIALMRGGTLSYRQLEHDSDACAAAFAALGVRPGDRVALCLPNIPQFLIAEFGAWKAGAIVCPVNPTYTEHELIEALTTTGAETVVAMNRYYGKLKSIQRSTSVKRIVATNVKEFLPTTLAIAYTLFKEKEQGDRITLEDDDVRLQDLLSRHRDTSPPAVSVRPDDPAVILMSGGTTGTPKGVVGLHRSLTIAGHQLQAWLRSAMHEWTDSIMLPLPLFHTYGNTGVQGLALMNHSRARSGKVAFDSIKLCFCGAAPLMAETKRRWEDLTGGVVVEGYSLTEAQMAVVANPVRGTKKIGSVGMPLPDVTVRIVDADDGERPLPLGEVGEIVIAAPQLMWGYWQRDDDTRAMIHTSPDGERLLYTGDLGYLDDDGYLFIVDRKKDLAKPSGFQVWPREVEEAISSHPAVAECGVVGLPDASRGEVLKAR